MFRMWDQGQRRLAAGRYVAARKDLEAAEAIAWRIGDSQSLARIYLPLLEARRQIRYQAAEGMIVITRPGLSPREFSNEWRQFQTAEAGTLIYSCNAGRAARRAAARIVGSVNHLSRRTGKCLESLVCIFQGNDRFIASQMDITAAGALPVTQTQLQTDVGESTEPSLEIPLPPAGIYRGSDIGLGAMARESLLVAWEALALRFQRRHPPPKQLSPWEEMAWLRLALRVDPACEPVSMRLIALAQNL